jgi:hypothetical protein
MKLEFDSSFEQEYKNLSISMRKKVDKALHLLLNDFRHPSLGTKKMSGRPGKEGIYEACVDLHNRMCFKIVGDTYRMRKVGKHDILRNP